MINIDNSILKSSLGGQSYSPKRDLRVKSGECSFENEISSLTFTSTGQIKINGEVIHDLQQDGPVFRKDSLRLLITKKHLGEDSYECTYSEMFYM